MKKTITYLFFAVLLTANLLAQSTSGFPYQSVMRDAAGEALANRDVAVRFSILEKTSSHASVAPVVLYRETHHTRTDATGLISLQIGQGTAETGNFSAIDYNGNLLIKTEINKDGNFDFVSTQPLSSVPYALSAETTLTLNSEDGTKWNFVCDNEGNLTSVPVPNRYSKLVFHDEFDGTGLPDASKWDFEEGYVRNGELQYYTVRREENCYQQDGNLHIVTRNDNALIENAILHKKWIYPWDETREDAVVPVTSASITTKGKFAFTYGRVEVRAKLPSCKGTWPAIWMMPQDDEYGYWPNSGEIDIMEHVGYAPEKVYFTLHTQKYNSGTEPNIYAKSADINDATDWHVYAFEWHEDRMFWYLDGQLKARIYKSADYTWKEWPFTFDFYLILNTGFGGGWAGREGVDLNGLPQTYTIDYIRVYQ